jgi:hypothetical protein
MVMSPLAIAYDIISSIINEVSPFNFLLLTAGVPTDLVLESFGSGDAVLFFFAISSPFCDLPNLVGDMAPFFGPFSLLFRTYLTACSFEKQSQMPSHATIIKSMSFFIYIFLMSGKEVTRCFLHSSMFL